MWISQKTVEKAESAVGEIAVGRVTVGGKNPAVLTAGEIRNAELLSCGGCAAAPNAGEEVLMICTTDEDYIVVGSLMGNESPDAGEVRIGPPGGTYISVSGSGMVTVAGELTVIGNVNIVGGLYVNGVRVA